MARGRSTSTPVVWKRKLAHFQMSKPPIKSGSALFALGKLKEANRSFESEATRLDVTI
jgi:hypothetical protein